MLIKQQGTEITLGKTNSLIFITYSITITQKHLQVLFERLCHSCFLV